MFKKCPYCNFPNPSNARSPTKLCSHCRKDISNPDAIFLHYVKRSIWIKLSIVSIVLAVALEVVDWSSMSTVFKVVCGFAASVVIGWYLLMRNSRD